jgi:PAS domain S-box-containing protein
MTPREDDMDNDNSGLLDEEAQFSPRRTVYRLLVIVAGTILITETVLMFVFDRLMRLHTLTEDLLDGVLLTILVSPVLYLYLFRPMHAYIVELSKAKGLLRQQRDHLEEEVQHRTAELVERNEHQARLMQELESAEQKYRNLVERLPSITYVISLEDEGRMVFVSPQIEQLGFAMADWTETPDFRSQRTHPEDRNLVRQAFLRSRNTGEPFHCDYRLFTRSDEVRWFHDEASVVRDEAGKALFLQGVMLDITENKAMEEELAEHRYRLEQRVERLTKLMERRISVLESANARLCGMLNEYEARLRQAKSAHLPQLLHSLAEDAVIVADAGGFIVLLNPVAERLLNIDGGQALRRPLAEVLPLAGNGGLNVEAMLRRCLGGEHEKVQLESATLLRKDDGAVDVFGWFTPIVNADGQATSLLVLLHPAVTDEECY